MVSDRVFMSGECVCLCMVCIVLVTAEVICVLHEDSFVSFITCDTYCYRKGTLPTALLQRCNEWFRLYSSSCIHSHNVSMHSKFSKYQDLSNKDDDLFHPIRLTVFHCI